MGKTHTIGKVVGTKPKALHQPVRLNNGENVANGVKLGTNAKAVTIPLPRLSASVAGVVVASPSDAREMAVSRWFLLTRCELITIFFFFRLVF